jgi:hypothetical protein
MDATGPFQTMLGQYCQEIGKQNREAINLWAALKWCWPRQFGQWLSAHPTPEFIREELAAAGYLCPSPSLFPRRSAEPNRITGADDHAGLCMTMRWRNARNSACKRAASARHRGARITQLGADRTTSRQTEDCRP